MWALFKLLLFFGYLLVLFTLPPALLLGPGGAVIGLSIAISFIIYIGWGANEHIADTMEAMPIHRAEAPELFNIVAELCRRLNLPSPKLYLIDSASYNIAGWGFSKTKGHLAVTKGLLELSRKPPLTSVVAWKLIYLYRGNGHLKNWLCAFLQVFDPWMTSQEKPSRSMNSHPIRLIIKQLFLYPLTLIPIYLLQVTENSSEIDKMTSRLTGSPRDLAEGFRLLESFKERTPLITPYSTRPLFLIPPPTTDPLLRTFFNKEDLQSRIRIVESYQRVVVPT